MMQIDKRPKNPVGAVNLLEESKFLRKLTVRTQPDFIFFLGAGCSMSSGIPSAEEMIWFFKREIYCTEQNRSPENFKDLSVETIKKPLQDYIEEKSWYPGQGADKEYSILFEQCWSEERERHQFIQRCVRQSTPDIGYKCLGVLISERRIINIITTNFDDLVERCLPPNSTISIFVVSPESATRLENTQIGNINPQLFKLHGDFRYDRLQNTSDELQKLNNKMQTRLLDFFREYGLIVVGYSGRDNSVMSMLEQAAKDSRTFKKGLYWCIQKEGKPRLRVQRLIKNLSQTGRSSNFVQIESFDEFLYHLYQQHSLHSPEIDNIAQKRFEQRRLFEFTKGESKKQQIIKINAIRIREYPTTLFQFSADIQDWETLNNLINDHSVAAVLYQNSVLATGNRFLISTIFKSHILGNITIFNIQSDMLQRNRGVLYYLYYRLIEAYLTKQKGLRLYGKRIFYLLPDKEKHTTIVPLSTEFTPKWVKNTTVFYHPAFSYQLEYHDGDLYFILKPTIILTSNENDVFDNPEKKIILNEILSSKYNREINKYFVFWINYLKNDRGGIEMNYPPGSEPPITRFVLEDHYSLSSRRM